MSNAGRTGINPNVAYLHRGRTRQSASDVAVRRLGQVEAYLTVREVLSETSTAADGLLSLERSGSYRCRHATLGLNLKPRQDALYMFAYPNCHVKVHQTKSDLRIYLFSFEEFP